MGELVDQFARVAGSLVEAMAVLTVAYGSVEAFIKLLPVVARPGTSHGERKAIWRRYGVWLLLGLEFELAADIIGSVVSPTWMDIGKLGAIAVIRTFLNYFLEKDLRALRPRARFPKKGNEETLHDRTASPRDRGRRRAVAFVVAAGARRAETAAGRPGWRTRCARTGQPGQQSCRTRHPDSVSQLALSVG